MLLKKGFINKRAFPIEVSKKKSIIGFTLFCLLSILFFNFLHIIRLCQIFFNGSINNYEFIIYSKKDEFIYNFLMAFIAVHFAFSIVYSYLFNKPNQFKSRFNYKRKTVLNNQQAFNWYFIYWFLKIALCLVIFSSDFIETDLLSEFKYLPILFIMVFIGQIWLSIRPLLKAKRGKGFLITLSTILLTSLIFSQISFINFQKIQEVNMTKNTIYKNNVHIVTSSIGSIYPDKSLVCEIIVPNTNSKKLIYDNRTIHLDELISNLFIYRERFPEQLVPFLNYNLIIDKNVKMKFINEIKRKMNDIAVQRVSYSVKKTGSKAPFYFKSDYSLNFYLPSNLLQKDKYMLEEVHLKIINKTSYLYNNSIVSKDILEKTMKNDFEKNGVKAIRVFYKEEDTFGEYFRILESSKVVISQFRNEFSLNTYGKEYKSLNKNQNELVRKKYFWLVIDQIN
jgi:hypothetical protein